MFHPTSLWIWLLLAAVARALASANEPPSAVRLDAALSVQTNRDALRDELFRQVFKRSPPAMPVNSYLLVVAEGVDPQKVKARLGQSEAAMLLEGNAIVSLLTPLLRPALTQDLAHGIDGEGWLNRGALERHGIATAFDARKFELTLAVPPDLRERRVRYLDSPLVDPFTVEAIRPATASAFLNFNVKAAARTESTARATTHPSDVAFATDGAVNVGGWVLEANGYGQTGGQRLLQRGDVRLVYDRPRQALRFTAGDLSYPVIGYQTIVPMLGLGFAKDFSLQPHVRPYRTGQFDFYLDRPAEVKVWVNDSLVNTLQLPAGPHDIRGLTPAVGANDMRLVIEDSAGRRQVLQFSFIFNPVVLDRGRTVFSYNAGWRRVIAHGEYRYDFHRPVVSASYLHGLTDETTIGGYTQADADRGLLGAKVLHLLPLGTLQVDTAASRTRAGRWDPGTRVELTHVPGNRSGSQLQTQVYAEYLGRSFGPLGIGAPAPQAAWNYGASVALPVSSHLTAQLSGSYATARRAGAADQYGGAATLSRRWGSSTTGTLSWRHRRSERREMVSELLVGLSVSFTRGRSTFYAAKELESDTVAARWDSGRPSNFTTPYGYASARTGSDAQEYQGAVGYWGNQGLGELSYRRVADNANPSGRVVREETAVRLQSALVFADGQLGLARTVIENFAIVTGKEGLAKSGMKVDPDGTGGSRARSNWVSPAVLGELPSYRLRDVRVEPVNPPLGATPERLTYALAPTYKSGFLLRLGKELTMVAIGRLVDERGEPLGTVSLEIRRVGRDEPPLTTFTSRTGMFQMADIRPGAYEIRPAGGLRQRRVTVEILPSPDGLYRLGSVTLPP
jgi:outer membrane usher protein